jgi:hypothetical protein
MKSPDVLVHGCLVDMAETGDTMDNKKRQEIIGLALTDQNKLGT